MRMVARIEDGGVDPICAATLAGFGFVFIHPFEDGNGRIHRFLIHHSLAKLKFAPPGTLFPVSAAMLRDPKAYDAALTAFSGKIMPRIEYEMDDQQRLTVLNSTDKLYRYYDATPQAEYLYDAVAETIRKDLREEIEFLEVFDRVMVAVQKIVDMPNARASLLIRLMLQNHGTLSRNKRRQFAELHDDEVLRIEEAVRATHAATGIDYDLGRTDLDEFLAEREGKLQNQRSAEDVLAQETKAEWQRLKDATRSVTVGKNLDGNPFEWSPYHAYYTDFLRLKDVAASFLDRGERNGIPQGCSIRFDRRSPASNQVFLDEKSPIPGEVWSLEPRAEGDEVVWWVKELGNTFTSAELASKVAIRLIKQYEAYEHAYGR